MSEKRRKPASLTGSLLAQKGDAAPTLFENGEGPEDAANLSIPARPGDEASGDAAAGTEAPEVAAGEAKAGGEEDVAPRLAAVDTETEAATEAAAEADDSASEAEGGEAAGGEASNETTTEETGGESVAQQNQEESGAPLSVEKLRAAIETAEIRPAGLPGGPVIPDEPETGAVHAPRRENPALRVMALSFGIVAVIGGLWIAFGGGSDGDVAPIAAKMPVSRSDTASTSEVASVDLRGSGETAAPAGSVAPVATPAPAQPVSEPEPEAAETSGSETSGAEPGATEPSGSSTSLRGSSDVAEQPAASAAATEPAPAQPAPAQAETSQSAAVADQTAAAEAPQSAPSSASASAPAGAQPDPEPEAAAAEPEPAPEPVAAAEAATPPAVIPVGGDYVVQFVALRSEADARAAWGKLQGDYPALLGNRSLDLQRADLGDKGVYFRVRTSGFGNKTEANELCAQVKAQGGDCLVRSR